MPNVNSIPLEKKQLLICPCGYHGNIVTIKMRKFLMPIILKKHHAKYKVNTTSDRGVIDLSLWSSWQSSYHGN